MAFGSARHSSSRLLALVRQELTRSPIGVCATCGQPVRSRDGHLRLRGAVYHAACARYRAPGEATAVTD